MLVLSRKKGESIIIQDQIELTILSVEGDTVRVGISAPKHVDIFRKEIYLSIQEANRESAAPVQSDLNALMDRLRKANSH
ncbi:MULTISPECIES: carbon storage regulator CsrA [Paenibacillus]|jgi:carbon storage regulator|uniref:Translational regulator CsrA n=1 Tax=Paenibacillus odorifer TaxID=189426 RepID=A0ABX3GFD0_9BACL|nr:carbon storage regulator CsrA [Paenibacillus odorifer]MEC0133021.1 carbon storage regulator CsrA [Paenibacillus odorifer]MEC0223456.1 carbon storage regulator CsrA [Paenibacillus odorifer]OMC77564.1 carbon storage regulator [Paenibacillus odorifer]OMC92831.1 carbon storage regulator [Paenibacillus odorifer]OMD08425.1 carbon storage regulator [Paenibacillus odorifer]